jgi:hypothetical protein
LPFQTPLKSGCPSANRGVSELARAGIIHKTVMTTALVETREEYR